MYKVLIYSILLLSGLVMSQLLPALIDSYASFKPAILVLTMIALSYIMINVGREFEINKNNLKQYGWDYVVAMTTATFPWLGVTLYFLFVLFPQSMWSNADVWKELFIIGRFAAPTSAGVLFAMLAAAGLGATWVFAKARVLAIFDDLDTVLLMIPLSILVIGWNPMMGITVVLMFAMLALGYYYLHQWKIPSSAPMLLIYSIVIALACELFYIKSSVHFEVLLPAFVLGCLMKSQHQSKRDESVSTAVAGSFMVLVGLSLPQVFGSVEPVVESTSLITTVDSMGIREIAKHVLWITLIANIGKMFPLFCYRKEASLKERLALSLAMCPRGEVGAGVIMISLSYGFGGPIITISMLALALNLIMTGGFILVVKKLIEPDPISVAIKPSQTTA
ncbi:sodium:proton antiporter [Vibrio sp. MACH09]|uniref:sodium:proton antiporter n=1 Tax=unclassified Vibrio TaxID=2614977 RepID=UPI001493B6D3|nr:MULTISPECIES: sodium:proton antiporter [unclassified Vibrio]NOI67171.1 sodium:proton antiporter [Vibrio sp. 99-8-1]GLO63451.1 sodium:proton antiporter [Vibrio sp. MACH09]